MLRLVLKVSSNSKCLPPHQPAGQSTTLRSLLPHTPHSPGHKPPVATSSTVQGSLPCSRKEITSGLEMARPGRNRKTCQPVVLWGLRILIQGQQAGQARKAKGTGESHEGWDRRSFRPSSCPLTTQKTLAIDKEPMWPRVTSKVTDRTALPSETRLL